MSPSHSTESLSRRPRHQQPVYLSALAAATIAGVDKATIAAHLPPDAWSQSASADKTWPLWLTSTVEAWAAKRQAGAQ